MPPQHETLEGCTNNSDTCDDDENVGENESHHEEEEEEEAAYAAPDEDDDETTTTTTTITTKQQHEQQYNKDEIILSLPPNIHRKPRDEPLKFERNWLIKLLKDNPNYATPCDLKDKALVVAPMVDQSDLPFRKLCRIYGSNLAFTPMIHCRMYMRNHLYRKRFTPQSSPREVALIGQLCGSDLEKVLPTALFIQKHVDAIDINCGCPQGIAKRGKYGAYLLEEPERLINVVRCLVRHCDIPITCKVRLLPGIDIHGNIDHHSCDIEGSLKLYKRLVDEGISMLTIHGRNRLQKGPHTGRADWDAIRTTVQQLGKRIPILANGSICNLQQVRECLHHTDADGIMCSEALLEYPALFSLEPNMTRYSPEEIKEQVKKIKTISSSSSNNTITTTPQRPLPPGRLQLAFEFLTLAQDYPPDHGGQGSGLKCIRMHIHRICHEDLQTYPKFRNLVVKAKSCLQLYNCLILLQTLHDEENHNISNEQLSWYTRYRCFDNNKKRSTNDSSSSSANNDGSSQSQQSSPQEPTKNVLESSSMNEEEEEEEEEVFHDLFGTRDEWGGI